MDEGQNKKRFGIILALIGAGIFVLGILFFSGKLGGNSVSSNSTPQGSVNIWGTLPESDVRLSLEILSIKYNKIALRYTEVPANELKNKLVEAIAGDASPDMVISDVSTFYSIRDYTEALPYATYPEIKFKQDFSNVTHELLESTGATALPIAIDPVMMFYNREILAASGYSRPPETWNEIYEMAPNIIIIEGGQIVRQELIAMGQYKNINNAWAIISSLFAQSRIPIAKNGSLFGKTVNLQSSDISNTNNAGEQVLAFYTQFSDPKSEFYTWNRSMLDSKKEFLGGRLAFLLGFASETKDINDRNPNLNFAVSALPQLNADPKYQATFGNLYVASVMKKTLNKPAAYTLLFEIGGPDFQKQFSQDFMMAPALNSLLSTPPETTYLPLVYKSALISKSWYNEDMAKTDQAFSEMIESVISGRQSVERAIDQAERVIGD